MAKKDLKALVAAFDNSIQEEDEGYDVRVRLTFIADVLGTAASDKDVYSAYIASNAPDAPSKAEEVEAIGVDESIEKGTTVFPRDKDGNPFLWDYQVRGFFKAACQSLNRCEGQAFAKATKSLKAYRKVLDQCVIVAPRKIPFNLSGEMDICQRPLRAETMQGPRVALASSETVPAGSTVEFTVRLLNETWLTALMEWLNYGQYCGFLQWRSSGAGSFVYEILDEDGTVLGGNKETSKWARMWSGEKVETTNDPAPVAKKRGRPSKKAS